MSASLSVPPERISISFSLDTDNLSREPADDGGQFTDSNFYHDSGLRIGTSGIENTPQQNGAGGAGGGKLGGVAGSGRRHFSAAQNNPASLHRSRPYSGTQQADSASWTGEGETLPLPCVFSLLW